MNSTYTFPTSFAQQRLWFLDCLLDASALYNIPWAIRLNGLLDAPALQQSFVAIIERHEVLRTSFIEQGGDSLQIISASIPFQCESIDLSRLTQENQNKESQRILDTEANKPFDLKQAPLIRALLVKLSEQEHILLVTLHHIISDGWSMGLFQQELTKLYTAFSQGQSTELSELPIQYADYAVWQREWLQGEVLNKQLGYWKMQLTDVPVLNLPTDYPRPKQLSYRGAQVPIHLSSELTQNLNTLSQNQGATLFMTLLAAFQVLLHRYSGQDDIVVGSPIAGRTKQETENLIGFFVNTLVLRSDLSGAPNFNTLLNRVRKVCLDAYTNQDIPFEKLVAELKPKRDLSRHSLFQVMLVLQPAAEQSFQAPDITSSDVSLTNTTAKFDLSLSVQESSEGLKGSIEYSTDLFEASTILRLIKHFKNLLEGIVANPLCQISDLPLLTTPERYQQLVQWNNTDRSYDFDFCIHQLFEAQVEKTPDAIAVVYEEQQLSYSALNEKANQLANYLQSMGVKPEVLVGICMERSLEIVIGLLGVLKAGGAYLPLDPGNPADRLSFMLDDAQVPILLTQSNLKQTLPEISAQIICLDDELETLSQFSSENIKCEVSGENLAYVIYTSGSTGTPKGAMNTHRGICNRLLWKQEAYQLTVDDKVLQKTPISFDVSVWEFFWTLLNGASLVIARPGGHQDSAYLAQIIFEQKITTLHFVPSMLQVFVEEQGIEEKCASLKRVFSSGEALTFDLQKRLFNRLNNIQLHNLYGPTEAAIDVTYWQCQRESLVNQIPIGKPIANTQVYILDLHLNPVPIGVPGELHIGGFGLARGYLNRPELTAEKFISNPFNKAPDARLYKTGDLAYYLPDGNIIYLNRIDNQVKLRGFRIELGEIESVILQHPEIRETAVIVREDQPGDKRLVAYLVFKKQKVMAGILRQFLSKKLPEYMLPSAFVSLEVIPLTPNGKADYYALPIPDITENTRTDFVSPSSPTEEILATLWAEILRVDHVSIDDNFFELGGHSLLATQVISRIRDTFSVDLPFHSFFESPTVERLAIKITQSHAEKIESNEIDELLSELAELSDEDVLELLMNEEEQ